MEMSESLLNNRYRIVRALGEGGIGAVYLVEDTQENDRELALKQLRRAATSDDLEVRWRVKLVLQTEALLSREKQLIEAGRKIFRDPDRNKIVADLAAKRDLKSAMLLVALCRHGSYGREFGKIAEDRAASDPQIAWAHARAVRRSPLRSRLDLVRPNVMRSRGRLTISLKVMR